MSKVVEMNQYIPNWDFDKEAIMFEINKLPAHSTSLNTPPETVTSLENSLAELKWKKGYMGYVAMQNLDQRVLNTPISPWDDNPRADGTLESVVNQATWHSQPESGLDDINEILLWSNHGIPAMVNPTASTAVTFELLVPRHNDMPMFEFNHEPYTYAQGTGISDMAGCSTQLVPLGVAAASASLGGGGVEVAGVGINNSTVEREILSGMDLTLLVNNMSGQDYTKTLADHYDSISHSRSQITEGDEEGKMKLGKGKSPISAKKSRVAAIHNESERKRRDRINQKMKALQELVPNSSKTDKVSMLDKAIECIKELQAQVKMTSIRNISPMMMQQQLEMSMMGVTNNINDVAALPPPVIPPPIMPVSTASLDNSGNCLPTPPTTTIVMPASMVSVMPDPAAAVLACESQPMTVDAYNRLATMYQLGELSIETM